MEPCIYYIIVNKDWPLSLEPRTIEEARHSIWWQTKGGFNKNDYQVCTWDPETQQFLTYPERRPHHVSGIGPFTFKATMEFINDLPS